MEKEKKEVFYDEIDEMLEELNADKKITEQSTEKSVKFLDIILPFLKRELTGEEKEYLKINNKKMEELKSFLVKLKSYKEKPENNESYNSIIKGKSYLFTSDNKDLFLEDKKYIYIYDNKEYKIKQKIEKFPKYEKKNITVTSGCFVHKGYLPYVYFNTIKLSNNKFIMISSYEMDLYYLDDKNKYSSIYIAKSDDLKDSKCVLDLGNNQFILCLTIDVPDGIGNPGYSYDKLKLCKLGTENYEKDLKISESYYFFKRVGYACLKEKYFLYCLGCNIYIYNLDNDEKTSFNICFFKEIKKSSCLGFRVLKYESTHEDEFILFNSNGEIILYKLIETEEKPKLQIIGYSIDNEAIDYLNAKLDSKLKRNKREYERKK